MAPPARPGGVAARGRGPLAGLELAFAASTVTAMVHRGEWRRVEPGVYAVSGDRPTTRQRTAAALLRCPEAAATGWTAAWLWDLVDAATTTIDLVVPAVGPRGPTTTRTRVRRSSTLTTSDVVVRDGLRVVTAPVTVDGVTIHLDTAFPAQRVAVEADALGFHSTRSQLSVDQRRVNLLQHTEWKVLRVGWDDVEDRGDELIAELRVLLIARGWRPGGQPVRSSR